MTMRGFRCLQDLLKDRSGVGAIEFALLLPVLIVLYVGAVEISDALAAKRKVTSMTSALGDLVTRTKDISESEMDGILAATPGTVLFPYPVDDDNIAIKVTCTAIDEDKVATVMWSEALNATKDKAGDKATVPAGVSLPSSKLVSVDVTYDYEPAVGRWLTDTVSFNSAFYFKPREDGTVCYDGTCC
jgi:Flp pilus assembly protein TadG